MPATPSTLSLPSTLGKQKEALKLLSDLDVNLEVEIAMNQLCADGVEANDWTVRRRFRRPGAFFTRFGLRLFNLGFRTSIHEHEMLYLFSISSNTPSFGVKESATTAQNLSDSQSRPGV